MKILNSGVKRKVKRVFGSSTFDQKIIGLRVQMGTSL
jgi:hypothetical protein